MRIKDLLEILENAPDQERDVYIPHTEIMPTSGSVYRTSSTSIGHNFDDNCDLELYVVVEE
jgi:hypothetical protein